MTSEPWDASSVVDPDHSDADLAFPPDVDADPDPDPTFHLMRIQILPFLWESGSGQSGNLLDFK